MSPEQDLLLILTRNPELGKCKTRLAAHIGDKAALAIYTFLLQHTHEITSGLNCKKQVYYSEYIGTNDMWDKGGFEKHLQQGNDLGERMRHAFETGFNEGYKRIVVIGSDMYDLCQKDLEQAFTHLKDHDAVIGPASDGGYYLLGMTYLIPDVFRNKEWGTASVFQQTKNDLGDVKLAILAERNDVDRYEDIKNDPVFTPFLIDLRS